MNRETVWITKKTQALIFLDLATHLNRINSHRKYNKTQMQKPRAVVIGGAMQDIYLITKNTQIQPFFNANNEFFYALLAKAEKIKADKIISHIGGGAVNVARTLQHFGVQTTAIYCVGKDVYGEQITHNLKKVKINTDFIQTSNRLPTGLSHILLTKNTGHLIFSTKLASVKLKITALPWDQLAAADFVYLAPLELSPEQTLLPLFDFVNKHQIPLAVNLGQKMNSCTLKLFSKNLAKIKILQLNWTEALQFATAMNWDKDCICQGQLNLKCFFNRLYTEGVWTSVITHGARGAYAAQGKKGFFAPGVETKVVDLVGAGDVFGAIFTANLFEHNNVAKSLRLASLASMATIKQIGACSGLYSKTTLNRLDKKENLIKIICFNL